MFAPTTSVSSSLADSSEKERSSGITLFIATDAIASFSVSNDASLTLINGIAVNTGPSTTPIDLDLTVGDGFLYTLEARLGNVTGFAVGAGATLTSVSSATAGAGSSGLQGIAAW